MSSLAIKYRPSNFNSLIGQDAIKETLSTALNQNKLADAYLFSGLRGSGKTSTARIFAKSIICQEGISSNPCEKCDNCLMIKSSTHIDIIEIDGASNRKIDDIRDIIENIKYKPSIANYKIYIIDEVHMLTKEAFNALLKTLEEPPSFIKFILATTDPLKVPVTIRSRTQHFYFRKISESIIIKHLMEISQKENSKYQKEGLEVIAKNSGGSLRDSITILEQAIIYSNYNITLESVSDMLGVINSREIQKLMEHILSKNIDKVLEFIEEFKNFEEDLLLKAIISNLKFSLYLPNNPKAISLNKIEFFFKIISEALILMDSASDNNFILTLTLFKMMNLKKNISNNIENIINKKIDEKKEKYIEIKKEKKIENIEPINSIIFDTETTGLSKEDRIIQIGAIIFDNHNKITIYDELCSSDVKIKAGAMETHHITEKIIENKNKFQDTNFYKKILELNLKQNYIIAHNINFDITMLEKENFINKMQKIDTLICAKHIFPNENSYKLQSLRYSLKLNEQENIQSEKFNIKIEAHNAIGDVLITKILLFKIIEEVKKNFPEKQNYLNYLVELTKSTSSKNKKYLGEPIFLTNITFGKYKGENIEDIFKKDRSYIEWVNRTTEDRNMEYTLNIIFKKYSKNIDKIFNIVVTKIVDKNQELGDIFKNTIKYISFQEKILTLEMNANDEHKKILRKNWIFIKKNIEDNYGIDITIKMDQIEEKKVIEESKQTVKKEIIEEAEIKDEDQLMKEDMVKKALELFPPTRVKIIRKIKTQ